MKKNRCKPDDSKTVTVRPDEPGADVLSVVIAHGMPHVFSKETLAEAARVPDSVSETEMKDRTDFRDQAAITIDGADAKDLDDAVFLEKTGDGWRLYVHIADVSHYVRRGRAMDKEALARGTSAYLTGRVIPMLPQKLSNGICSLNAGEDRLAVSCVMDIDRRGWVISYEVMESVINVRRRVTYEEADAFLAGDVSGLLRDMEEVSELLRYNRVKRGAIELSSSECAITLDGKGRPIDIKRVRPGPAAGIIEEFMIACNEAVAQRLKKAGAALIYRTHEPPERERVDRLFAAAGRMGLRINRKGHKKHKERRKDYISSKDIRDLLALAEGTPYEEILDRLALASMKQARYTADNHGHFGLASRCYCHFTAPIRRYPDIWNHRALKDLIKGAPLKTEHYKHIVSVCERLSLAERRAADTEREVESMKKAEYMRDKLGEAFAGRISGVKRWGMYVELENTVEGLVGLYNMDDDYYIADEENGLVYGERRRKIYRLGDKITVRAVAADAELRRLDFIPLSTED
jgi:ribonuclease R